MLGPWRSATFDAMRHRNFQHYTWGQIVNLAGTRIHEVASGWLMWELTGSATWVGALAFAEMGPRLILWPLAGVLADRIDRRLLAIFFQTAAAVIAWILVILTATDHIGVYSLLVIAMLFGVNSSFWQPIRLAIIPRLVTRDAMPSAIGLASVVANVARIAGPLIAGPVLLWGSATLAFTLNAISYVAVVLAFWLMRLPADEGPKKEPKKFSIGDLSFGILAVVRDPGVRTLLGLVGIFALCVRPTSELLPVFAEAAFGAGPAGLASLISAIGVGSLFSGIVASGCPRHKLVVTLAIAGVIGSISTAAFAAAPGIGVALICIAVVGFGVTLTNIVAQILLQLSLTDDISGRVLSIYGVTFAALPGIGAIIMGWAADQVGIASPVIVGAMLGVAASVVIYVNRQRLALALDRSR